MSSFRKGWQPFFFFILKWNEKKKEKKGGKEGIKQLSQKKKKKWIPPGAATRISVQFFSETKLEKDEASDWITDGGDSCAEHKND